MKKLSLLFLALLLSACGGGSSHSSDTVFVPPPTPTPVVDAYYTRVMAFVGTQSETDEPGNIDLVVVTSPESDDPVVFM
ncbi:MAG: hypothetical protein ACJ8GW_14675 [Massilia sp.]